MYARFKLWHLAEAAGGVGMVPGRVGKWARELDSGEYIVQLWLCIHSDALRYISAMGRVLRHRACWAVSRFKYIYVYEGQWIDWALGVVVARSFGEGRTTAWYSPK